MQKSKLASGARIFAGLLLLLTPMGFLIMQSVKAPPPAAGPPEDVQALIIRRAQCSALTVQPPSQTATAAARAKAGCASLASDEVILRQRYRYNIRVQEWLDAVWVDAPGPAKSQQ